ncbi:MAG: TIGR04282 family arsenosugar biosynthesis glycosyltransferase [Oleispira sp.]
MVNKRVEWVVLSKAPVPGRVKTRLIPSLGEQGACNIYEQLLARLKESLKDVISNTQAFSSQNASLQVPSSQVALWIAGDCHHQAFNSWSSFATFYQQPAQGGLNNKAADLGERMAMAVQSSLARGCIPILIGVDVPDLDEAYLTHCLQQIIKHDLVISPAEDGGYGLLGMKQFHPQLFANKCWGTDTVFSATLGDIQTLKIKASVLPQVWDVDEIVDVERFRLIQS